MHLPLCAVRESGFTRFKDEMVSKVSSLGELMQDSMLNSFYLPKSRCKMLDTQWYLNSRFGQCKMAAKITRHWEARICKRYVYQWYVEKKKTLYIPFYRSFSSLPRFLLWTINTCGITFDSVSIFGHHLLQHQERSLVVQYHHRLHLLLALTKYYFYNHTNCLVNESTGASL